MRVLIAGTGSGCGKTTASILLMACLKKGGLEVAPYKVGPDYIDPGFHRRVCGRPSHNLDSFLMEKNAIISLLENDADISVIEGVMGYYDGLESVNMRASSYELAEMTRTPVILVVDASGGAASVAATVKGFMTLRENSNISGVLVNRASGQRHYELVKEAVKLYTGLDCVGYLTKQAAIELPSRHLGLVTARETPDLLKRVDEAADAALETLDIDALKKIADRAPQIERAQMPPVPKVHSFRMGVALDDAFHFYYDANLDYLRSMGMELVYFSPLDDVELPKGLDALYIGGGYPEVFSEKLSANRSMRESVKSALEKGLKCYAECGGLMYLSRDIDGIEMCGFLPISCRMTKRLQRFGYVTVREESGLEFPAHEFHHAVAEPLEDIRTVYTLTKASSPDKIWQCGYVRANTLAAFAHVHFYGRPDIVERFWL